MSGILPAGAPSLLNSALNASGSIPLLATADAFGLNSEAAAGQWGIYPAPSSASTTSFGQSLTNTFNNVVTAAENFNLSGIGSALLGTQTPIIKCDSVIDFNYSIDAQVPTYPIEAGGFSSYNKVQTPFNIKMTMALSGSFSLTSAIQGALTGTLSGGLGGLTGVTARSNMLTQLENARHSLALVNVVTPERTFQNCNVVHYDYDRSATSGATLLLVDIWLAEIRVSALSLISNVASPNASDPANTGTSQVVPVTAIQQSALSSAGAS
jgi:hypothetical protein